MTKPAREYEVGFGHGGQLILEYINAANEKDARAQASLLHPTWRIMLVRRTK